MKEKLTTYLSDFSKSVEGITDFPVHLSGGNEEALIKIYKKYKKGDWIFSTHRSHYHWLLSGRSQEVLKNKVLQGKSMHVFDDKFFTSAIVGGVFPIAVGVALALKLKKSKHKVFCFAGDMAFGCGIATESIRYAHNFDLPILFINEDNGKSVDASTEEVWGKVIHYKYERKYKHAQGLFKEHTNSPYHANITSEMTWLGKKKDTIFLGQNVICGNFCGTLTGVPLSKRIELPVAEELQMGMSIGLSLEGFVPISCYPRMDFLPRAFDQVINHLNLIGKLSDGLFRPKLIIRTSKGLEKAGPQHNKNLYDTLSQACNFSVKPYEYLDYENAYLSYYPTLIIEEQEKYG